MQSRIFAASGEEMLGKAIALTLQVPAQERADLFEQLVGEIVVIVAADSGMRPWTCSVHPGLDGSRVYRGGTGLSLVIDPRGRLWRARSYEDFDTTYTITPSSCEIATLKPHYDQMREYVARCAADADRSRGPDRAKDEPSHSEQAATISSS
jgi:hypothetical protein